MKYLEVHPQILTQTSLVFQTFLTILFWRWRNYRSRHNTNRRKICRPFQRYFISNWFSKNWRSLWFRPYNINIFPKRQRRCKIIWRNTFITKSQRPTHNRRPSNRKLTPLSKNWNPLSIRYRKLRNTSHNTNRRHFRNRPSTKFYRKRWFKLF